MSTASERTLLTVLLAALSSAILSGPASAHIKYVTDEDSAGSAAELFAAVFNDPGSVALLVGGALGAGLLITGYLRFSRLVPDIAVASRTLQSYRPYLPWMLRLTVGLPLVGAGFAGYLFTPSLPVEARLLQVAIGFLLLFGLATRLVAAVGLVIYLGLLATDSTLLLASEYIAGFLAIMIVGAGQPSADMLLRRLVVTEGTLASRARGLPTPAEMIARVGIDKLPVAPLLRLFVGVNFMFLGVTQKWLNPAGGIAVVEKYNLTAVVPVSPELWVFGAGLVEAAVGVAFILGLFTRGTAAVGFLMLTTTLFGLPDDPVLAHITLFGLLSALLVVGSGRYSLDASLVPAIRRRLDPDWERRTDHAAAD
ncbi:DoxX family protein [Halorhabdus utahensis DSM 12940]|uniref:DoxX family protein n=1 Tax=Halorhabdus utahensis (strain DSM 12940 / JCM 11049 / AX-2) TaxID=519442 RepID=C7NN34_HALUD|nr:DoxX family protein [Halorhabdus utahensis]ACV11434.1 DoxX family protein [Halorhabdus utahensis DSM 12940]